MFILNYILYLLLYIKINSYLYFSFYLNKVEDCISKIYIGNKTLFDFFDKYNESICISEDYSFYPNKGNPLIHNEPYNFGDIIYMDVYDNIKQDGYVKITITINEYKIETKNKKFWQCLNCKNNNSNDYIIKNSDFIFYFYENNDGLQNNANFTFTFRINSILELNYEDIEINDSFYALNSSKIINLEIDYKNEEVELINFNSTDNFYIKDDNTLLVNYSNYYFQVTFENDFNGSLKGLNFDDNLYHGLNNNSFFKVNETNGLIYQLSPNEKKKL